MDFIERFANDGWLRIDRLFDRGLIDALDAEADRQTDRLLASGEARRDYRQVGEKRVMLSVEFKDGFLDPQLYAHPIVMSLLGQLLGGDFLIDSFTCVTAMPGASEQELHVDHSELFPGRPGLEAELDPYVVVLVIPLIDLTAQTGTTRLFPGTHAGREAGEAVEPLLERGDCFLMDYRMLHQGLANVSKRRRPVLFLNYARPWFIDYRNFGVQARVNIGLDELKLVDRIHRPLFRRAIGKGTLPLTERELKEL